jgi:hypothetical protein
MTRGGCPAFSRRIISWETGLNSLTFSSLTVQKSALAKFFSQHRAFPPRSFVLRGNGSQFFRLNVAGSAKISNS